MKLTIEDFKKAMLAEKGGFVKKGDSIEFTDDPSLMVLDIESISIHRIALDNPPALEADFNALKESISEIGQQMPILMFRNKVIDGRNRINALRALGIPFVLAKKIPNNTTLEDVRDMARSTEIRRHQTSAQKAIKAYKLAQKSGITKKTAAERVGIRSTEVSRVERIAKALGTNIIDRLFEDGKVKLGNGSYTGSLQTIIQYIKSIEKAEKERKKEKEKIKFEDKDTEQVIEFIEKLEADCCFKDLGYIKECINRAISK